MTRQKASANSNVTVYRLEGWHEPRRKRRRPHTKFKEPVCMCCGYPETLERLKKE